VSTFVLVHGASHGAWCWKKVVPLLEQKGHTVIAPDLPGHGQDSASIADVTLEAYTDRVCDVLDKQNESVILVGHSMAGVVIAQVAEYRPEKMEKLVFITAVIPANGESLRQATENVRNPDFITVADDESYYSYKDELVKDIFYGDCSDEDIAFAKSMLVPQPTSPVVEPVHISEGKYGRVPRVFIECLQDRILLPHFQKGLYTAFPCEQVISMNTSHSPFFSAPEALTNHLLSLAQRSG
jgi:pimeloyl-ACP methyl ester carboxylesterase